MKIYIVYWYKRTDGLNPTKLPNSKVINGKVEDVLEFCKGKFIVDIKRANTDVFSFNPISN